MKKKYVYVEFSFAELEEALSQGNTETAAALLMTLLLGRPPARKLATAGRSYTNGIRIFHAEWLAQALRGLRVAPDKIAGKSLAGHRNSTIKSQPPFVQHRESVTR